MATETAVIDYLRAARPAFRNAVDKIAFAVHAAFFAAGYSLIATGAKVHPENPPTDGEEVGLDGWNELEDTYVFVYTKAVKGAKKAVLVKCLSVGKELAVDALDLTPREGEEEQPEPLNALINIRNHVEDGGDGPVKYSEMYRDLKGLLENLNEEVFSKLEPVENASSAGEGSSASRGNEGFGSAQPAIRFGYPPNPSSNEGFGFAQPAIQFGYPPNPSSFVYPPVGGGYSDLHPGPPAGFYYPRPGYGGDMLVGPNDPRWLGGGMQPGYRGGVPGVPPGARFDPYGPPDVPGFEPGRFVRQPPLRPRPGGGVHPDLEHFSGPNYF